ncbi:hypothetical protein ASPZODRAFT_168131 [Penicilliopsis zonata CBS 506.65]|uniref:Ig-like domain-containing protein n=1 Tax=Penicilliopsis zonata CBS 506.65 TaxID=1073090 RepID=A0A1L9SD41_9EURO|nr:hypothetical protein ASPZODRAFT_168131 [Penicilliopsis zonata CBS 506.65]OJJ45033.1 hypothetical protein ASPZODRAFT_168131 [Penicilliopsis zonata CBS 506.65]
MKTSPWALLLLAGQAAAAGVSEITLVSTVAETVTSTYSSTVPVTTTITSCTPVTAGAALNSCPTTAWSTNGAYWSADCSAAITGGTTVVTGAGSGATASVMCVLKSCQAVYANTRSNLYYLVTGSFTTTSHTSAFVLNRYTTNPCVVTETAISTDTWYSTITLESTFTYTETVTLSTSPVSSSASSAASSSASSSSAAASSSSIIPSIASAASAASSASAAASTPVSSRETPSSSPPSSSATDFSSSAVQTGPSSLPSGSGIPSSVPQSSSVDPGLHVVTETMFTTVLYTAFSACSSADSPPSA